MVCSVITMAEIQLTLLKYDMQNVNILHMACFFNYSLHCSVSISSQLLAYRFTSVITPQPKLTHKKLYIAMININTSLNISNLSILTESYVHSQVH